MPVIITRTVPAQYICCADVRELPEIINSAEGDIPVLLGEAQMLHAAVRAAADADITVTLIVPPGAGSDAGNYPELRRALAERLAPPAVFAAAAAVMPGIAADEPAPVPSEKKRGFFGRLRKKTDSAPAEEAGCAPEPLMRLSSVPKELDAALSEIDESFTEMLLRKIDERGMTDAQCYKKANIDRKLFSKIRSDIHYHPKKTTVIAFAIALELDLAETGEMLRKAGFALSRSSKFDIIVEYFIENGRYDVFEINEALFAFDQSLIGG